MLISTSNIILVIKVILNLCRSAVKSNKTVVKHWTYQGQPKIALRVNNFEQFNELHEKVKAAGLNNFLVIDAGCTQLTPETPTVIGVGPGKENIKKTQKTKCSDIYFTFFF